MFSLSNLTFDGPLTALKNILSAGKPSSRVLSVKADTYASKNVLYRADGVHLYKPADQKDKFEIVLFLPGMDVTEAFSLFRSDSQMDAENKFTVFKSRVPKLISVAKEMSTVNELQKLCDVLTEHPTWNFAHLAVNFGLFDALNNDIVSRDLNSSDEATGMSPLQLAIKVGNIKMVQMLLNSKCSLEHLDYEKNTVFHYAATTSKEIIMALGQDSPACLNARNKNGHTPLHMACMADKRDCVKALLFVGGDVNISATRAAESSGTSSPPSYVGDYLQENSIKLYEQDIKLGGTPLHWSMSREVIEALIDRKCDIDALNFDGRTALHVMVIRDRLECVVALLSNGANPDLPDLEGNTPLHHAVKEVKNVAILQSLLVFGANVELTNLEGHTPRHYMPVVKQEKLLYILHSVGAKRCPEGKAACDDGCKFGGAFDGIPPPPIIVPNSRDLLNQLLAVAAMETAAEKKAPRIKGGRVLSLDGGGIRGLVLVQVLLELQKYIDRPISECFDWIAGTSTGGIIALALACGKTLRECMCIYFRMKEQTFIKMRPYPADVLESILQNSLGMETVMADIKHPKLMITSLLADRKPSDFQLFRNYQSPSQILGVDFDGPFESPPLPENLLLWHVGRATGAAPTYFKAFGRFLDGGLIANNPTIDALTEIHEYNLALKYVGRTSEIVQPTVVVSVGTGSIPVTQLKDPDIFAPASLSLTSMFNIPNLLTLLVDQATQSDGRVVDRARSWCSTIGIPFYRFCPQLSQEVKMDERSDEVLVKMLWETKSYMHSNADTLKELASLLCRE